MRFAQRFIQMGSAFWAGCLAVLPSCVLAGQVTVFAAASLKEPLEAAAAQFEAQSGHDVVLSFAGSSTLARQITYGAPADVFVSANVAWMEHLIAQGALLAESEKTLFGNRLALVVSADQDVRSVDFSAQDLAEFLGDGRMAMAQVEAVPAGIYGRQAFEALGLWPELAPQVAQVDNVRAALALVALGEARAGVVYVTDAAAEERVQIAAVFPEELHDDIVYPAAIVRGQDRSEVRAFMRFWEGEATQVAFAQHGFRLLRRAP